MGTKTKIIITGGGIGGLTTAVALQQQGFDAHVYEAAQAIRPVGKGIWLPTNAMLVLDRLSLGDAMAAKGLPLERIEVHDKRRGLLQAIDLEKVRRRYGRTTTSILRADLQSGLVDALREGTLHLDRRCADVQQGEEGATVIFEDGSNAVGDIVVGADGIRSVVRNVVAPRVPLRYSGQTCYLGVATFDLPPSLTHTVREIWGGRERFGFSGVGQGQVYWFAPIRAAANTPMPTEPKETLRDYFQDFPAPVPDIIDHTPASDIIRLDLHDFEPLQCWHKGRIVLLGDAAHAMTPNLGQGGAQAIEDAYVLARTLGQHSSPEIAFRTYTKIRQPKATRIAQTAWRLGQVAHTTSPWMQRIRNVAFRWTPDAVKQRQAEALYRLDF